MRRCGCGFVTMFWPHVHWSSSFNKCPLTEVPQPVHGRLVTATANLGPTVYSLYINITKAVFMVAQKAALLLPIWDPFFKEHQAANETQGPRKEPTVEGAEREADRSQRLLVASRLAQHLFLSSPSWSREVTPSMARRDFPNSRPLPPSTSTLIMFLCDAWLTSRPPAEGGAGEVT